MRILSIHSDFIEFQPLSKAIKDAEEAEKKLEKIKDCLVIFSSVEAGDAQNPEGVAGDAVKEIMGIADQIKVRTIVLYPFVHLTSAPAAPSVALAVLKKTAAGLSEKGFDVSRAPFGWYKSFDIKCKGHPLSELSREIRAVGPGQGVGSGGQKDEKVSAALKAEEKAKSSWFVLDVDGKMHALSLKDGRVVGFDFSKHARLGEFASYEMAKSRELKQPPAHMKYMRELELVDHEFGSDPGNLRYYPKGRLVKSLLEQYVTEKVIDYGGMEVETPIMYDVEHPSIKKYFNRFPARQYLVETPNKTAFLRFAACFGQFLMAHDMTISYRDLPVRLYELTRYSFRAEKHGELAGLRRLRAFTMPDCHAFCADLDQAKKEFGVRFALAREVLGGIGLDCAKWLEMGVRITQDFWEQNKDFVVKELIQKWNKPVLLEMWDKQFFYFTLKYELNFVDSVEKAAALSTDQFDIENSAAYDINFVDKDGKKKLVPIICHLSPSGAIERVMYALLEKAFFDNKAGKPTTLPTWLCPTQVRIIPVSDKHVGRAEKIAAELEKNRVRVDIDDRQETIGKKVRAAEMEWIPYYLVVGDKEENAEKLPVKLRETGEQKLLSVPELAAEISKKTAGMPFKKLPLSKHLAKRPVFVG